MLPLPPSNTLRATEHLGPAKGHVGDPLADLIWKCSLGYRRREWVEPENSGPAKISEKQCLLTSYGSLPSPNLGHFSFFHTKVWREQCSHVGCQGSLQQKVKACDGVVVKGEEVGGGREVVRVYGERGGCVVWGGHRIGGRRPVAEGAWSPLLCLFLHLLFSPCLPSSFHHRASSGQVRG